MDTHEQQHLLTACIRNTLAVQTYSPPRRPDPSAMDAFSAEMARAVLAAILADGWAILPPITKSRDPIGMTQPSDMTPADAEDDLRGCINFALKLFRFKPPRSRKQADWERYHRSLAEETVRRILMSNWELIAERTLRKIPPAGRH
jgi:hypothetical protein